MKLPSSLTFGESHTVKHSNRKDISYQSKSPESGKIMALTGARKKSQQVQIFRHQGKFFPTRSWVFYGVGDCKRAGTQNHAFILLIVSYPAKYVCRGLEFSALSVSLAFLLCPSRKGVLGKLGRGDFEVGPRRPRSQAVGKGMQRGKRRGLASTVYVSIDC